MDIKKRLSFLGAGAAGGAAFMAVLHNVTDSGTCGSADLWTILSAIATAAATAVALVVALDSNKQRRRDEQIRARLGAARLAPALLFDVSRFDHVVATLQNFSANDGEPGGFTNLRVLLEQIQSNEPSFEMLQSIAPLPNECADRIASGFAQIRLIHSMLIKERAFWTVDASKRDVRRNKISALCGLAIGARDTLAPTVETCNQAALVKIGGPAVK